MSTSSTAAPVRAMAYAVSPPKYTSATADSTSRLICHAALSTHAAVRRAAPAGHSTRVCFPRHHLIAVLSLCRAPEVRAPHGTQRRAPNMIFGPPTAPRAAQQQHRKNVRAATSRLSLLCSPPHPATHPPGTHTHTHTHTPPPFLYTYAFIESQELWHMAEE